jgi:hypothetical protein
MTQSAVATEVHKSLYVDCDLTSQVTLDDVIAINRLTYPQHFIICHIVDTALEGNSTPLTDLPGRGAANAMDVG